MNKFISLAIACFFIISCAPERLHPPTESSSKSEITIEKSGKLLIEHKDTYKISDKASDMLWIETVIKDGLKDGTITSESEKKWMREMYTSLLFGKTKIIDSEQINNALYEYNLRNPYPSSNGGIIVPETISKVWVIIQDYGQLIDGVSQFYDFTDRKGLIANIEKYVSYAKGNNKRLIITASNETQTQWYHNDIKYNGNKLKEALYRSPDQPGVNYMGAEIPIK